MLGEISSGGTIGFGEKPGPALLCGAGIFQGRGVRSTRSRSFASSGADQKKKKSAGIMPTVIREGGEECGVLECWFGFPITSLTPPSRPIRRAWFFLSNRYPLDRIFLNPRALQHVVNGWRMATATRPVWRFLVFFF